MTQRMTAAELIAQAQQVGKLPKDFQLQPRFADNSPERLQAIAARHPHLFPEYPLGSDFSAQEQDLLRAELAQKQIQAHATLPAWQGRS